MPTQDLLPFQCFFPPPPQLVFFYLQSVKLSLKCSKSSPYTPTYLSGGFDEGIWQVQHTFLKQFTWRNSNPRWNRLRKLYFQKKTNFLSHSFLGVDAPYKWLCVHMERDGAAPVIFLVWSFAKGHRKNLPTNWKTSKANFTGNLQGLILRIWLQNICLNPVKSQIWQVFSNAGITGTKQHTKWLYSRLH